MTKTSFFEELKNVLFQQGLLMWVFFAVVYSIFAPYHVYIKDLFCMIVLGTLLGYKDKQMQWLFAFSLVYTIMIYFNGLSESHFESLSYLIGPVAFYLWGKAVMKKSSSPEAVSTFFLLLAFFSSYVLITNNLQDVADSGIVNIERRIEGFENAATMQGLVASIGLIGVAYVIAYKTVGKLKSLLFIILFVFNLFVILHLINRTGIVVALITIFTTALYTLRSSKRSIFTLIVVSIFIYLGLQQTGILSNDLLEAYQARNDMNAVTAGERFDRWGPALGYLFIHPFGWVHSENVGFAHNLWLDIARRAGFVPFVIFLVFTIKNIRIFIKLLKLDTPFVGFLVGVNTCFLISASVEPVIEARSTYFYLICMVWGIQYQYYLQQNKIRI